MSLTTIPSTPRVEAERITVQSHRPLRFGVYPAMLIDVTETRLVMEPGAEVTQASESVPGQGYDTLVTPVWGDLKEDPEHPEVVTTQGRNDLVGREIFDMDARDVTMRGTGFVAIGTIASFDPATATLVLEAPLAADPTGKTISIQACNSYAVVMHDTFEGARSATLTLDSSDPLNRAKIDAAMFLVLFNSAKEVMTRMDVPFVEADLQSTLEVMAQEGVTYDSFATEIVEDIVASWLAGEFQPSQVSGDLLPGS